MLYLVAWYCPLAPHEYISTSGALGSFRLGGSAGLTVGGFLTDNLALQAGSEVHLRLDLDLHTVPGQGLQVTQNRVLVSAQMLGLGISGERAAFIRCCYIPS